MSIKQSWPVGFNLGEGSILRINSVIVFVVPGILLELYGQDHAGSGPAGVISPAFRPIPSPTLVPVVAAAFDPSEPADRQQRAVLSEEGFGAASKGGRSDLAHVVSYDMGQKSRRYFPRYFSMLQAQSSTSSGVSPAEDIVVNWEQMGSNSLRGAPIRRRSPIADDLAGDPDAAGNPVSQAGMAHASSAPVRGNLPVAWT